ncbi:hypothetical protein [Phocaeicola sp.]|uniref:hypothetical protein n=1 Tax=Phocaeicola sp. TaxID=2773926 RepID=UPI003866C04E
MIQTKTLKEALKDPGVIEVVEGLLSEVTYSDKGLMPANLYKQTSHYVQAFDATYKIADYTNGWWLRDVIIVCTHIDATPFLDIIALFRSDIALGVRVNNIIQGERSYKYYKKDYCLYLCFTAPGTQPNNAYIMSPYGINRVGDAAFIDDSFTEIV